MYFKHNKYFNSVLPPKQGISMIKMNCVLLTACIVLLAFSSSGYALRCYHCENSPSLCKTNSTCLSNEDTCLQMRFGKLRTSSCWKLSQCNVNDIAVFYQLDNFDYFCCQQDLCNEGTFCFLRFHLVNCCLHLCEGDLYC
uniref:CD59 glycoprotein n=1 Tax=Pavo cristatus TaxID=9049 RepID=A0A8C9EKH1_PAVCR